MHSPGSREEIPFLIIGAARSGTTLLSLMLNNHPRLAVPPETFFFNTFSTLLKFYGDLSIPVNRDKFIDDVLSSLKMQVWRPIVTREQVVANLRGWNFCEIFKSIAASWAQSTGKPRWGEKTPQNVFYWKQIKKCLPRAQVINIVRDGRDVALSMIKARFGPKTIYRAAQRWVCYIEAIDGIKSSIPERQFHEVHYEDLLRCPEETLGGICAFLGEKYSKEMLDYYKTSISSDYYSIEHENISLPLLRDHISLWRDRMSMLDIEIFEAIAGSTLRASGYKLATRKRRLSCFEKLYHRCILNPPLKLTAMLLNRPGQIEALQHLRMRIGLLIRYALKQFRQIR